MRDWSLLIRMSVVSAILFGFYLLIVRVGLAMGVGLPVIVGGLVVFVGIQYVIGTRGVLRQMNATDLPRDEFRAFHEEFEDTAREMGFDEPPRLMVTSMGVPNAFAVGRKNAGVVVVSIELLELLDFDEAAAVTAHELAHLDNRDSILMVVGESISTIIGLTVFLLVGLSDSFVVSILGWILGILSKTLVMLFVMALSRYREFAADRDAAAAMGSGDPLARALTKIQLANEETKAVAPGNVSALCIHGFEDGLLARLFSTHPSTEKRVERLKDR